VVGSEFDVTSGPGRDSNPDGDLRPPGEPGAADERTGVLGLAVAAVAVGAWAGLVVSAFRLALSLADQGRDGLVAAVHMPPAVLGLVLAACAGTACVTAAAWIVRRYSPFAAGSGIPEVEAALDRELQFVPLARLILVKFVGGVLAIGSGLALGPEGPSVQMGAAGARILGDATHRPWRDVRALIAAGAGAGLAAAFNAPIAGAVFVLEELERRFEHRTAVAAVGASCAAILVSRLVLGDAPIFQVAVSPRAPSDTGPLPYAAAATLPIDVALGAFVGIVAALYNRLILAIANASARPGRRRREAYPALIGATVGIVAWVSPDLVGSGSDMTASLLAGTLAATSIPAAFAVRYALGTASHSAFTPGGLFAPLLLLGAQLGLACGTIAHAVLPGLAIDPVSFAVVGMAAYFVGVVRAPVTGIVLVIEMTAAFTSLLPMLAASFGAMVVAQWLGSVPIYEALRSRAHIAPPSAISPRQPDPDVVS
jgi:CIC family chloride channel protein